MQELEKILEEIDIKIAGSMGRKREGILEAEGMIRKHRNENKGNKFVRDDLGEYVRGVRKQEVYGV